MAQDEPISMSGDDQQPSAESFSGGEETAEYTSAESKAPSRPMLAVLGLVLAIGAVILVARARHGPAAAKADDQSAAAKQAVGQFLSNGTQNVQAMEAMLRNTEKLVQRFASFPNASQVPLADLRTNPFRMGQAATGDEAGTKRRQEEERQAALKAVAALQLQSIIYGESRRACMVNGELLAEGQQVGNFTIEKISADAVVVKTGVYRFELKMQK